MSSAQRSKATRRRENRRCRELTQLREINPAAAVRRENQLLIGWSEMYEQHLRDFVYGSRRNRKQIDDEGNRVMQDMVDRAYKYGLKDEIESILTEIIDRYLRHPLAGRPNRRRQGKIVHMS